MTSLQRFLVKQRKVGLVWSRSGKRTPCTRILTFRRSTVRFSNAVGGARLIVPSLASKVSAARLRLTEEETTEAERGKGALDKVSASVFVRMGLELEDQQ